MKKAFMKTAIARSFKFDKSFWKMVLLNICLVFALLLIVPLYAFILRQNLDSLRPFDSSAIRIKELMDGKRDIDDIVAQDMDLVTSALKHFVVKTAILSVIALAVALSIISYFEVKMWSLIKKVKFQKLEIKLALLIFFWNLAWFVLLLFITYALKFKFETLARLAVTEFFLYIYFSILLLPVFFKTKMLWATIKEVFLTGILKFYNIVPALFIMWLILTVGFALISLAGLKLSLVFITILPIFVFIYISWTRVYIDKVLS